MLPLLPERLKLKNFVFFQKKKKKTTEFCVSLLFTEFIKRLKNCSYHIILTDPGAQECCQRKCNFRGGRSILLQISLAHNLKRVLEIRVAKAKLYNSLDKSHISLSSCRDSLFSQVRPTNRSSPFFSLSVVRVDPTF